MKTSDLSTNLVSEGLLSKQMQLRILEKHCGDAAAQDLIMAEAAVTNLTSKTESVLQHIRRKQRADINIAVKLQQGNAIAQLQVNTVERIRRRELVSQMRGVTAFSRILIEDATQFTLPTVAELNRMLAPIKDTKQPVLVLGRYRDAVRALSVLSPGEKAFQGILARIIEDARERDIRAEQWQPHHTKAALDTLAALKFVAQH